MAAIGTVADIMVDDESVTPTRMVDNGVILVNHAGVNEGLTIPSISVNNGLILIRNRNNRSPASLLNNTRKTQTRNHHLGSNTIILGSKNQSENPSPKPTRNHHLGSETIILPASSSVLLSG